MRIVCTAAGILGPWVGACLTAVILAGTVPRGLAAAASPCLEMYQTAFKGKAPVKPANVGKLYLAYCKKNMRVGSAKSMDELCQPIVKKVEEKMGWVPPNEEVTPELVCKTIDQIKQQFPEHAANAAEILATQKKHADAEEAEKKGLADQAKALGGLIEKELADVLKKAGDEATKDLKERLQKHAKETLGGELDKRKESMIKKILESITLGIRGVETKSKQKSDESLKEWLMAESKERLKARADQEAKKGEL